MTVYGLTATGFVVKTQEVITDEMREDFRNAFGRSIGLGANTVEGNVIDIVAERYANLWELLQAVHDSTDPDSVVDAEQDILCALTGTVRKKALSSTVTLTLTGTPATPVGAGSQASVESTNYFKLDADATIATLSAWVTATAYVIGDRVTSNSAVWECTVAGTSSTAPDPTGLTQGQTVADGTVTWRYLGNGTGAVDTAATATVTGPVVGLAGTITKIETSVSGWLSVYNNLDADEGRTIETNETLRVRREQELSAPGNTPKDAIRAELLKLNGVKSVKVFSNRTGNVDADGVPPHSVEALVQGGTDQEIFDQLLQSVADGVGFHGNTSGTAVDSEGVSHVVKFSRPVEIEIYVDITLKKEQAKYGGDTAVKTAITGYGDAQDPGRDAVSRAISGAVITGGLAVLDVPTCYIGTAPSPSTETTIVISKREIAVYDTSRITVTASDAEP